MHDICILKCSNFSSSSTICQTTYSLFNTKHFLYFSSKRIIKNKRKEIEERIYKKIIYTHWYTKQRYATIYFFLYHVTHFLIKKKSVDEVPS